MDENMEQQQLTPFEKVLFYFESVSVCDFIEKYGEIIKASKDMTFVDEFSTLLDSYRNTRRFTTSMRVTRSTIIKRDDTANGEFAKLYKEFSRKSDLIEEFIDIFENIQALVIKIFSLYHLLNMTNRRLKRAADKVVSSSKKIYLFKSNISNRFNYERLTDKLNIIKGHCDTLIRSLPKNMGFEGKISTDHEARTALDYFINTALRIRSQPGFENSILHKLDLLLENVSTYVHDHFANIQGIGTDGTFIALAAPSMEGKTQSAFVFRRVKPLYFPLSGLRSDGIAVQPIYKNFAHLSDALIKYALSDLINLRSLKQNIDVPKFNQFDEDLKNCEYWTLGFLCHLVEDGRNISGDDWMLHHAERPSFDFEPKSINSLRNRFFHGFCIFLDEFKGNDAGLFIRNLARVSNLTCMVANTNSRISNLTKGLTSGGNGINIWSLVAPQLNSPDTYSDIYDLNTELQLLRVRGQMDPRIDRFISDFVANQAKHLRPGVANYIKAGLSNLNAFLVNNLNQELNIKFLLDSIVESLSRSLRNRKPTLSSGLVSHLAKIGLLFPVSYVFEDISDISSDDQAFHQPSFLEYHLYHLVNPTDVDDWLFMTFAPIVDNNELRLLSDDEWSDQLTYFKGDDLLTILGCMWISFVKPVSAILKKASETNNTHSSAVSDMPNENALKLPGNVLEISAAVSVVDSSHHFFERHERLSLPKNTFAGQNGIDFIKNIIVNLIDNPSFSKLMNVSITFTHQVLSSFLSLCHVPFLYGINRRIQILDSISDAGSSVFFESFTRPGDENQVDGFFRFKYDSNYALMTVECKNRKEQMTSDKLESILQKSHALSSKVCLVFCNEFIDKPSARSKFIDLCRSKLINVYRIKRDRNVRTYSVNQFSNLIFDAPQSVCILFESKRINAEAPM